MTGFEIGLIVACVVMFVFIAVILIVSYFRETDLYEKKCEVQGHNDELSENNRKFQDTLCERNIQLEAANDKLKAIERDKMSDKEWWITVVLKTLDNKEEEETFKAKSVMFDNSTGIVLFYSDDYNEGKVVYVIERENYILHKKELVDVERKEESK